MRDLDFPSDENVLVGTATCDDAGVYRISEDLAIIQTVDFFTPIVDDPYDFGQIAAANALSDVYAMGGSPKTAMNIVAFPIKRLGRQLLKEMLAGGIAKLKEADTVLLGGHSIEDEELKYGLSVTGFVHPLKILANQGLLPGDCLVLTKPLGTGIINTAIKAGLASKSTIRQVTEQMAALNRLAAEALRPFHISACTDVTGFGFLGHMAEMICGTKTTITLLADKVPVLPETYQFAAMGMVPAGAHKNRLFRQDLIEAPEHFDPIRRDILFDPQTSGGLLFGCRHQEALQLVARLHDLGIEQAAIIAHVEAGLNAKIIIQQEG